MRFLIAGLGSIGRRHLRNLAALGERDVVLFRSRLASLPDEDLAGLPVETDLARALERRPDAVIVATPTALHQPTALPAAEAGCHLLIEKPISHNEEGLDSLEAALRKTGAGCLVGYHLRFHPLLRGLKRLIDQDGLGRVRIAQASWGEYLPDWHPWEDHRRGYAARGDQGGGAALTLSHPFDYLLWLFGNLQRVSGSALTLGGLGIDVDDCAEADLVFDSGVVAAVHLDYYRRPAAHWLEVTGDRGTARLDFAAGTLESSVPGGAAEGLPAGFERNDLFLAEMRHFLEVCRGEAEPLCGVADGRRALRVALGVIGDRAREGKRSVGTESAGATGSHSGGRIG